jgi:hypothetical protein
MTRLWCAVLQKDGVAPDAKQANGESMEQDGSFTVNPSIVDTKGQIDDDDFYSVQVGALPPASS